MQVFALIATGVAVLASMSAAQSHGYIVDPAAQWADGYPNNGYGSTVDNEIWGVYDNSKYGYGVNGTLNFFKATFPTKGYKSLGAFFAKNQELYSSKTDPDCGLTVYKDSARSKLPASQLEHTGFTHTDYIPAKIPYDEAKCAKANRLTIYWLALHGDPWQVYTDCVWLEGGVGKGAPPSPVGAGASTVADASSSSSTPTVSTAPSSNASPSTGTTGTSTPSTSTTDTSESKEIAGEASTYVDETQTATTAPPTTTSDETTPATETATTPSRVKCSRRNKMY
ncbi:hypothetical protein GN958_ATG14929 [Phytophthora infestans]|uniref:Glycoside hydrolase n=1 Tax=Phytophthora infestans TaxID=4787 RepID=A0A8S9U6S1_PHYIN|nr:hypothetical protein GN958_ATG14929 [Phytophthora infestans]